MGSNIVHGRLKVVNASVEGIRGQTRAAHASTSLQLLLARRAPGSDSEHVSWVCRHGRCDGQTVDVGTACVDQGASCSEPKANVGPDGHDVSIFVSHASLDKMLVEGGLRHGAKQGFSEDPRDVSRIDISGEMMEKEDVRCDSGSDTMI